MNQAKDSVKPVSEVTDSRKRLPAGRTIIMSEQHYRRIIWTLALSCMAIGFFSMWGVSELVQTYGLDDGHRTPVWLAWIAFLGLPLAGRVILSQSLKGY